MSELEKKVPAKTFRHCPMRPGEERLGEGPSLPLAWRYYMRYYWKSLGETGFLIGGL